MRATSTTWAGVTATVYYLDKGEKGPRHRHGVTHTTQVIIGAVFVEVFDGRAAEVMGPEDRPLELPANIDHEITATMDGTIILNMIAGDYAVSTNTGQSSGQGGVMLHDGTVIPHDP